MTGRTLKEDEAGRVQLRRHVDQQPVRADGGSLRPSAAEGPGRHLRQTGGA